MKTKVYILYTGGTVGMAPKDKDDPFSALEPKPLAHLLGYVPGFRREDLGCPEKYRSQEAKSIALQNQRLELAEQTPFLELPTGNLIEFGSGSFEKPVDSSDICPTDWAQMAAMIAAVYDDYDGFVILHGTDTMAFTSSALSFMLQNLAKPVIITGSQLPIAGIRTDAVLNFINAIYIAGYRVTDLPLIPEVVIVFADRVIRGCRASKVSTADWAGFDSPNFPLLGTIGEHIVINTNYVLPPPKSGKKFFLNSELEDRVFNLTIFPGFRDSQIRKLLEDEDIQGVVLRTFGTGNIPNNTAFLETIERAITQGKVIVNLSQCGVGKVEMGLYEASSGLLERGVLSGLDMTPEAALTKLMWSLGSQYGQGKITQMQISQCGEQTENLFDLRFGSVSRDRANPVYTNAVVPDGRLDRGRIASAMLRISGLGVVDADPGAHIRIRAYMNMPSATHSTRSDEDRCVAIIEFTHEAAVIGQEPTRMKNITSKTYNVIGQGDVIMTLVAEKEGKDNQYESVPVYFRGLYVAVYAKS